MTAPAGLRASSAAQLDYAAREAMARKDAPAARRAVSTLLLLHPKHASSWLTASILELELGQGARALELAERGLALAPAQPTLLVQRLRCLHARGRFAEARASVSAAVAAVRHAPAAQHELGNACAALGEHARALNLMLAASRSLPNDPALNFNIAAVQRYLGRFAEAERRLDLTIRHSPQDWEAYGMRSQLRTQTTDDNHVAELETLLARGLPSWVGHVQLRFALAKEYEDLGEHDRSFTHLRAGALLRRQHLRYDVNEDVAAINHIIATLNKSWWTRIHRQPAVPDGSAAAIFLFGLPRSGTTLVDRILGCHPDVVSHGELNDFPASVISFANPAGGAMKKQELITAAAAIAPYLVGRNYLSRVAQLGVDTPRFIDKLPMNYLYAGLIAAALPHARLVHVTRHPMANAYGMYKTLFHQGYPFSYDLDELGRYIAAYHRLMAHWRELLGDQMITLGYETLIGSQDATIRFLLDACDLPWHAGCLTPHRNTAPSTTQSAVQVRQPIYSNPAEQWRRHAQALAPLTGCLIAEGVLTRAGEAGPSQGIAVRWPAVETRAKRLASGGQTLDSGTRSFPGEGH